MAIDPTWKERIHDPDSLYEPYPNTRMFYRDAMLARNCFSPESIECRTHGFYNGSGAGSFGDAKMWPGLTLRIPFMEGQEPERDALAALLQQTINTFMASIGQ